jgi:hypothetical protein
MISVVPALVVSATYLVSHLPTSLVIELGCIAYQIVVLLASVLLIVSSIRRVIHLM